MTFEIHSDITNRSMAIASRAMRKVLRRKRSILWAVFGWSVFIFNALLLIPFNGEPFTLDASTVISLLVEVMLLSVLLFQDRFNGMIARKNALAGTKEYHVAFGEDSYCKHSCRMRNPEREVGKSCFFLQIASQSHFSGAFEAENNENGCISALGLK